jgi:hypothetical protein
MRKTSAVEALVDSCDYTATAFVLASGGRRVLLGGMKPLSGVRVLQLIGGLGALLAAVVLWNASDSHTALTGVLAGLGLILLAWMQFGEEFRRK